MTAAALPVPVHTAAAMAASGLRLARQASQHLHGLPWLPAAPCCCPQPLCCSPLVPRQASARLHAAVGRSPCYSPTHPPLQMLLLTPPHCMLLHAAAARSPCYSAPTPPPTPPHNAAAHSPSVLLLQA